MLKTLISFHNQKTLKTSWEFFVCYMFANYLYNRGAIDGARTRDNWYHKPGLYQLSYDRHIFLASNKIS